MRNYLLAFIAFTGFLLAYPSTVQASCPLTPPAISCGQVIKGALDFFDCPFGSRSQDAFQFNGNLGDTVTLSLTSSDFPPTLLLYLDPFDTTTFFTASASRGGTARIQKRLPKSGTWTVTATNGNIYEEDGNYTLTLACSGATTVCIPGSATLCLNAGRFQVNATYDAGNGNAGTANAVPLTSDTGYFWFFNSSNVEMVIKVLDACGYNQRFWVYAGGLTNVRVVVTVTDTVTGAVKTYTNPRGTAFLPIQDTSAFATCL